MLKIIVVPVTGVVNKMWSGWLMVTGGGACLLLG